MLAICLGDRLTEESILKMKKHAQEEESILKRKKHTQEEGYPPIHH